MADIAQTLTKSVARMQDSEVKCEDNPAFNTALTSALQELSLRITQLGSSACNTAVSVSGVDLQERRQLAQKSRQLLQEATLRLKENHVDAGLLNALKGCLVALRSSEHMAAQQLVTCVHPVLQTLSILEKSSTSDRLTLNVKLLGMRLTKFLQLSGRKIHDLRGPQRRGRLQTQAYIVTKVFPSLVNSIENALQRPNNVYDRAAKHLFFNVVKQSTESMVKLFTSPSSEELEDDNISVGKLVKTIDNLLDEIDNLQVGCAAGFETIQERAEWLVSFAMNVAKAVSNGTDEKDIINGCHHLVNELGNLKDAFNGDNVADLTLAKDVAKDFIEVTEQSVNSALLRLIVLSLSQLHVPLDRLIHAVLSSDKVLPNRTQEDIHDLIEASDTHADRLFHIAHFAVFCTSDASTAQSLTNSLHLLQILEKELVPACLKVYFNPEDTGARTFLKTLRQHWKNELDMLEAYILDIVDPTAFCVIVEAEARRIAAQVKKDQYSQSRDFLRLSVSQVVRLCQMAVDFAWKEMSSVEEEENRPNPRLPEDHPIIRVERSTWEVQAALKMVIANVEDLRHHKILIRRVQLMVTCATAMVECLMDPESNRTDHLTGSRVKVLTSVSRINIGANQTTEVEESKKSGRILSKSFKNITMNNTIGVSRKNSMQLKAFAMSFNGGDVSNNVTFKMEICSRKAKAELEKAAEVELENSAKKELHRKVKLHSTSEGFRSPLKQISNQLATSGAAAASHSQQLPRKASVN